MSQTTYPPIATGGTSYSSQPPTTGKSVILDGILTTVTGYGTTIVGTGSPLLLTAATVSGQTQIIVNGVTYNVPNNTIVVTPAINGTVNLSVSGSATPIAFGVYNSSANIH